MCCTIPKHYWSESNIEDWLNAFTISHTKNYSGVKLCMRV